MLGIIFSILAGVSMSLQGVFNTRLGEKIGTYQSNFLVQFTGFVLTLMLLFFAKSGSFSKIKETNLLYLTGGVLGVVIIFTVMAGIKISGVTCAISVILVSQLLSAALIDAFGLFGTAVTKFGTYKVFGLILMLAGVVLFKWKC